MDRWIRAIVSCVAFDFFIFHLQLCRAGLNRVAKARKSFDRIYTIDKIRSSGIFHKSRMGGKNQIHLIVNAIGTTYDFLG